MSYTTNKPDTDHGYVEVRASRKHQDLNTLDRLEIIELFKVHGALLLRGFHVDQQSLNNLTSQYCSGFVKNKTGGRIQVADDGRSQSVNIGREAFPFHPELSQVPWRPDIAWFVCANPPGEQGETTLCDGIKMVDALDPDIRAYLDVQSFVYKKKAQMEECEFWTGLHNPSVEELEMPVNQTPFVFSIENGTLFKSYTTPALYKPMFSNKLAFGSFLLFRRFLHKKNDFPTFQGGSIVSDSIVTEISRLANELSVAHRWEQHDILMVDNTRFMHGRNAIKDATERRIVTQFGYASFRSDTEELMKSQPWRRDSSMLEHEFIKF